MLAAVSASKENNKVILLEKNDRLGKKLFITGKGRCNFTNVKEWNDFSQHIRSKSNFVKPAFYNMDSGAVLDFFEKNGMKMYGNDIYAIDIKPWQP